MNAAEACPCGSGEVFGRCCRVLHTGQAQARTALELMRARYSAFAAGDGEFLWRTWHPRTRPTTVQLDTGTGWTSLEVVYVAAGEPGDERGEVEFRAHYRDAAGAGVLHERSTFLLRARRWFYLDGDIHR